ncbi:Transcription factor tfb2, partial [Trichuris suis]
MSTTSSHSVQFLEFLKHLPKAVHSKLFESPTACLALLRFVSPLAQQLCIRLVLVGRAVPSSLIHQWCLPSQREALERTLETLHQLHILEEISSSHATRAAGVVVSLSRQFAQNLKQAMFSGQSTALKKAEVEEKHRKSPEELKTYAMERWESVLNYMALPSGASEKSVSMETRQTLNECGLIRSTGGTCELTSDGFQFLLMSVERQIWTYLLHYISVIDKKGVPVHSALMIILYACVCGVNSPYCTDAFTEADLNFVQHLREVGLVYLRKRKSGWFYYTPLLARITGCSNADDSVNKKPGFLVVETNFRVYCYTDSILDLAIVSTFCELLYRFPNLIVAILTRESVRHAFKVNISAEQIIQYLNTNAHRNMLKKRPVIPATITDQLKLWELEHDRFTFQSGVLYSGFLSDSDYAAVRNYAKVPAAVALSHVLSLIPTFFSGDWRSLMVQRRQSTIDRHRRRTRADQAILEAPKATGIICKLVYINLILWVLWEICRFVIADVGALHVEQLFSCLSGRFLKGLFIQMENPLGSVDSSLLRALTKPTGARTAEDVEAIYAFCRRLEELGRFGDQWLKSLCAKARLEIRHAGELLFRCGQVNTCCCYVLLSGSIFINGRIYLPLDSFGELSSANGCHKFDCIVLEPSAMIAIDCGGVPRLSSISGTTNRDIPKSLLEQEDDNLDVVVTSERLNVGQLAVPHPSTSFSASFRRACCINDGAAMDGNVRNVAPGSGGDLLSPSSSGRCCSATMPRRSNSVRTPFGQSTACCAYSIGGEDILSIKELSTASDCDDDLAGLPEVSVDSDDEDESYPCAELFTELRDLVRECLEKEPSERSEDDVAVLLDFMQHMPAFANLPSYVKCELCRRMVFAVVDKAATIVMKHGEQLDSWSVIINGEVEVIMPDGSRCEYRLGDCFGVEPTSEAQYHCGEMRTLVDDCQFVLVAQEDYVQIMSRLSESYLRQMDARTGHVVCEKERRVLDDREGYVLTKATPSKLIEALIEDRDSHYVDSHYVEDMLLMYRTFIDDAAVMLEKILSWFADGAFKEKVARLVLLWVNNHFNDFESSPKMMSLLEKFEGSLEDEAMYNHQQLLNIACSVKSRSRLVTYARSNRDEVLHFSILGGSDRHCCGIYIAKVDCNSAAERVGLKRGDQILEVNGNNFRRVNRQRALEILRSSTHLSMTVKNNLLGFKEMLSCEQCNSSNSYSTQGGGAKARPLLPTGSASTIRPKSPCGRDYVDSRACHRQHKLSLHGDVRQTLLTKSSTGETIGIAKEGSRLSKLIKRLRQGSSASTLLSWDEDRVDHSARPIKSAVPSFQHGSPMLCRLKHSRSNPDLVASLRQPSFGQISQYYQPIRPQHPEHILKIYRGDQSFKYLSVYKETTSQNVVQLALQEFGMSDPASSSLQWSLCEVTVTADGLIKQRRLPEEMQNLAERISLNSRYYLKNNNCSVPLVTDDQANELLKESETVLMQLHASTLAAQLTLQDFAVFASIEPTEYVDNLFKLDSRYGWPKLDQFEQLVNRETWWVATEVCKERSLLRRAKIVKKFIKIAKQCRDFKNFNSMFAIVCGLEKPCVRRLHNTWDKVSSKYRKVLEDLQLLMDPSRNMSKYRQHLTEAALEPPSIPLLPVLKKDLTFIHECNPTWCDDGLVNFEKLRMIAKEIRFVVKLASAPYELSTMFQLSGNHGQLNDALLHMNTFEGGSAVATMKRQMQQRAPLPRKKLYEQALMVRRVKAYLNHFQVIDDESTLDRLSLEVEPMANGGATSVPFGNMAAASKRSQASPSFSSGSSVSISSIEYGRRCTGPKFGMESPQAVQKLLSLVDHSRVRPLPPGRVSVAAGGVGSPPVSPPCPPRRPNKLHNVAINVCQMRGAQSKTCSLQVANDMVSARMHSSVSTASSTDSVISQQSSDQLPTRNIPHAISCDSTDSGHASLDTASVTVTVASSSLSSPPSQRQSYPPRPTNTGTKGMSPSFDHYLSTSNSAESTALLHRPSTQLTS